LSPGKHALILQLKNQDGIVLDSIHFYVFKKTKFWKYPLFQLITIIGSLILIATTVILNQRKRKSEIRVKLLETEKELLASKANESKALLDKRNTELEFQLIKTSNRLEILNEFKSKFKELSSLSKSSIHFDSSLRGIKMKIDRELKNEVYWDELQDKYYRINEDFIEEIKLQYPSLSKGDLDFILLLRRNLTSKEIAALLNITIYAVRKRKYRIKKKMNLNADEEIMQKINQIINY
jgi:DNA-binding CsgD family transcriptional regulator